MPPWNYFALKFLFSHRRTIFCCPLVSCSVSMKARSIIIFWTHPWTISYSFYFLLWHSKKEKCIMIIIGCMKAKDIILRAFCKRATPPKFPLLSKGKSHDLRNWIRIGFIKDFILRIMRFAPWVYARLSPLCCPGSGHMTSDTDLKRLHGIFY